MTFKFRSLCVSWLHGIDNVRTGICGARDRYINSNCRVIKDLAGLLQARIRTGSSRNVDEIFSVQKLRQDCEWSQRSAETDLWWDNSRLLQNATKPVTVVKLSNQEFQKCVRIRRCALSSSWKVLQTFPKHYFSRITEAFSKERQLQKVTASS